MKIIDMGCGANKHIGNCSDIVIGLDAVKLPSADIIWNLNIFPYPFKSNVFDKVICHDVIEHAENPLKMIEEIWRISKNNSIIMIRVPHFTSVNAFKDITHKNFFTSRSMDYFDVSTELGKKYNYYSKSKYKILKNEITFHKKLRFVESMVNRYKDYYEYILRMPPATNIEFELKVIK